MGHRYASVCILKIEWKSEDTKAAATEIEKISPQGLDVIVANAGVSILDAWVPVLESPTALFPEQSEMNIICPILLFKAMYPLALCRATRKLVFIFSMAGGISDMIPLPITCYGASKIGMNFISRGIHIDN